MMLHLISILIELWILDVRMASFQETFTVIKNVLHHFSNVLN